MNLEPNAEVVELLDLEPIDLVDLEPITIGQVTELTGSEPSCRCGDFNIVWGS